MRLFPPNNGTDLRGFLVRAGVSRIANLERLCRAPSRASAPVNMLSLYTFSLSNEIRQGAFHPLRELQETEQVSEELVESSEEVIEA